MKKINLLFGSILAAVLTACSIHVAVAFVNIAENPMNSAPASVAFLLILPYGLAAAIVAVIWAVVVRRTRRH